MFETILGAVLPGLIGGLFGGKKKTQETVSRVDYKHIRDGAEAAGFNPLTALKFTGSANATSTTTLPALTTADVIARALGDGLEAFASFDPMKKSRDELELKLMEAELERIQKDAKIPVGYVARDIPGSGYTADPNKPLPEVKPKYVRVYDHKTGRYVEIIDPEWTESGPAEMATGIAVLDAADAIQNQPYQERSPTDPPLSFPVTSVRISENLDAAPSKREYGTTAAPKDRPDLMDWFWVPEPQKPKLSRRYQ